MNLLKKTGLSFLFLLGSFSLLQAQESSVSKLDQLEGILLKLENELLNSRELLLVQEVELDNLNQDLTSSGLTIESLNQTIKSSKNNIKILETTILSLKREIETSQNQIQGVSNSLEKASISFEKYERTTKIIMWTGGTIILTLAIILTYKIIEDI